MAIPADAQELHPLRDCVVQSSFFQAVAKNWLNPVPEKAEEGRAWIKMPFPEGGPLYHYHNETKELYRVESNDWAIAKTIGVVVCGGWYYWASHLRHLGSGIIETAKTVKTIYDDYQIFKGQAGFSLKTFAKNKVNGTAEQPSAFKSAIGEFKQAAKDYGVMLLFTAYPVLRIPEIVNISALSAGFIAYSVFAPLNSRVLLDKLETWWRPAGVKPLTDREVADLSVWQNIKHLTDGSYSLSHLFKTNRIPPPKQEQVAEVKVEQQGQVAAERAGEQDQGASEQTVKKLEKPKDD